MPDPYRVEEHPALVVVWLHNGFSASYDTNEKSADVLKDLLIPNPLVKAIYVYHGNPPHRKCVLTLTYTQLKELRANAQEG